MINEVGYWTFSQSEVIISPIPHVAIEIPILLLSVCTVSCHSMCYLLNYPVHSLLSVSDRYVLFYKLNACRFTSFSKNLEQGCQTTVLERHDLAGFSVLPG